MWPTSVLLAVVVSAFMAVEARRASRNERGQRSRGGVEPRDDVFAWMQVAYPGAFVAMLAEGVIRGAPPREAYVAGAVVFAAGKALKWWALVTLRPSWTFRVLVVPGMTLVKDGPYRFLKHPNYVGVVGELAGVGLMTGALIAGPAATALFGALILKRMRVEE